MSLLYVFYSPNKDLEVHTSQKTIKHLGDERFDSGPQDNLR